MRMFKGLDTGKLDDYGLITRYPVHWFSPRPLGIERSWCLTAEILPCWFGKSVSRFLGGSWGWSWPRVNNMDSAGQTLKFGTYRVATQLNNEHPARRWQCNHLRPTACRFPRRDYSSLGRFRTS